MDQRPAVEGRGSAGGRYFGIETHRVPVPVILAGLRMINRRRSSLRQCGPAPQAAARVTRRKPRRRYPAGFS
jgi:hypothetical protein